MTTAYTSCSVCWWPNTIYYLLYTPESASRAYETIKCFSHNKVSLVAWLFICLALLFGVSFCHCLFCITFRHSFMVTVPVRLCKLGEFSIFVWDFLSSLLYHLPLSNFMVLPLRLTSTEKQLNGFQNSLHSAAPCEPGTCSTGEWQCQRPWKWGWVCWDAFIFFKNWQGKSLSARRNTAASSTCSGS